MPPRSSLLPAAGIVLAVELSREMALQLLQQILDSISNCATLAVQVLLLGLDR
ncbi:MAG: hypothetical protein H0U74_01705 [Bradymonadaceae bacterium]|nr:hypothetical protein [Lujinxingiaceae bacterium]